jgi:nitroimidazol reductase NimA-like FMN-containing flavoprotein (pyridoxamine 5'-phosphate oxidase superfamily)
MVIRELTRQASLDLLTRIRLGRLACARANQPCVFPIFFAYHENSLYCASTIGQKIEWMRENPLVAVEVDEIHSAQQWESVIVSGRYEEFADTPEMRDMRQLAWSLLQKANELWWEPGYVKTIIDGAERPMAPIYFRIRIERITGHRATKE